MRLTFKIKFVFVSHQLKMLQRSGIFRISLRDDNVVFHYMVEMILGVHFHVSTTYIYHLEILSCMYALLCTD